MPGYFQQTIIIGAVGRDPDVRETNSGKTVASFSVAVTERWRDRDGKGNTSNGEYNERTTWYTCTAWEKQAELVSNLIKKGQNVMVIGTVSARGYIGNDNQPKASLDLRVDQFKLLGSRPSRDDDDDYGGYGNGSSSSYGGSSRDIDEIPF